MTAAVGDAELAIGVAAPGLHRAAAHQGEAVVATAGQRNGAVEAGHQVRDELVRRTVLEWRLMTDAAAATWGEYIGYSAASCARPKRIAHLRLRRSVTLGAVVDDLLHVES